MNRRTNPGHHPGPRAVPALLVTLGLLMSGCTGSSDGGEPLAESSPSAATPSDPDQAGTDSAQPLVGDGSTLTPGIYQFSVLTDAGLETPDALVDVPSGFVEGDEGSDWYVVSPDGDTFLGLWMIGKVDRDACLHDEADASDPGSSVQALGDALVAQKSTRASGPDPVTLAGHRGLYVELVSPRDISRCGKYPALWRGPERPIYGGGQVDQVWILDVDGQRLVADASYAPTSSASERDHLTSMVDSLEFVPAV